MLRVLSKAGPVQLSSPVWSFQRRRDFKEKPGAQGTIYPTPRDAGSSPSGLPSLFKDCKGDRPPGPVRSWHRGICGGVFKKSKGCPQPCNGHYPFLHVLCARKDHTVMAAIVNVLSPVNIPGRAQIKRPIFLRQPPPLLGAITSGFGWGEWLICPKL